MHLWTIPIEIIYYFIIPLMCLAYKSASAIHPAAQAAFLTLLGLLTHHGCNHNLLQMREQDYATIFQGRRHIAVNFQLAVFVFVAGTWIALALHAVNGAPLLRSILKRLEVQLILGCLSLVQFGRAYQVTSTR